MENGWIERDRKWLDRGRWEYSWMERDGKIVILRDSENGWM